MDLYRINCFEEVVDIGLFEILESGDPCLIEWAEKLKELTYQKHVLVKIDVTAGEERIISYQEKEGKGA
jgi:tRNA A37 threonylcarbamoyladenosine biosynthesis protein TsaE